MKRGLLGCLVLFLIIAIGGAYAAYRFLYLPGKAYVQSLAQLKVVPELDAKIVNQQPFTPPSDQVLSASQVQRFMGTQQAIRTQLGTRVKELEAKYRTLGDALKDSGRTPSLTETLGALKELAGLYVDAKKTQVDALNAAGLSLAEYEWTRARVYEASGLPLDTTFQQIIRDATAGRNPDSTTIEKPAAAPAVPDANRKLIEPHTKELAEGAALAFFGL